MRLLIAALSLCSLLAACGGSTPAASPGPTDVSTTSPAAAFATATAASEEPAPDSGPLRACRLSDLAGAFVSPDVGGAHVWFGFGLTNASGSACELPGAPQLIFRDAGGADMHLAYTIPLATDCGDCYARGALPLPPGAPTPRPHVGSVPLVPGQVSLSVIVPGRGLVPDCTAAAPQTLGLVFSGDTGELDVPIDAPTDYVAMACWQDVFLREYAPSLNQPGPAITPVCTSQDLAGKYSYSESAAGSAYLTFMITDAGTYDCSLPGPPALAAELTDGSTKAITGRTCTQVDNSSGCLGPDAIVLSNSDPNDHAFARIVVSAGVLGVEGLCSTPSPQPQTLIVMFSGISPLTIPFGDTDLGQCAAPLSFVQYP